MRENNDVVTIERLASFRDLAERIWAQEGATCVSVTNDDGGVEAVLPIMEVAHFLLQQKSEGYLPVALMVLIFKASDLGWHSETQQAEARAPE